VKDSRLGDVDFSQAGQAIYKQSFILQRLISIDPMDSQPRLSLTFQNNQKVSPHKKKRKPPLPRFSVVTDFNTLRRVSFSPQSFLFVNNLCQMSSELRGSSV
jgi:hypothetical protein